MIKLHHGDCLEILKSIEDQSVDFIFADPPYETTRCNWDKLIPFDRLWIELKRVRKDNTPTALFAQAPFDKLAAMSNYKEFRYEWIWEKTQATGHLNAKKMPMKAHENILIFYKKLPKYNPQKTKGHTRKVSTAHHKRNTNTGNIYGKCDDHKDYDSTERYPRSVLRYASDKQKLNLHPTQKPLALVEYIVNTYTDPGDVVLDFCAGSGTVGVACKNLGRGGILIEKDIGMVSKIAKRLKGCS